MKKKDRKKAIMYTKLEDVQLYNFLLSIIEAVEQIAINTKVGTIQSQCLSMLEKMYKDQMKNEL